MAHQTQNTAGKPAFTGWLPWVLDILCTFENTSSRTKLGTNVDLTLKGA